MKKKQLAPIGADPIREFIARLPKEVIFLGAKGSRSAEQSVIHLVYSFSGSVCETSFSKKGGAA